eukprot:637529-Heterocapsa_arctica.AAC.1
MHPPTVQPPWAKGSIGGWCASELARDPAADSADALGQGDGFIRADPDGPTTGGIVVVWLFEMGF